MRHVRGNVVAYLALFVALGGTGAWAAGEIGPRDIARDAVHSKHINDGAVKSRDLGLSRVRAVPEEISFQQAREPRTRRPGLSVAARRGDLIVVHARVEMRRTGSAGRCVVRLNLDAPDGTSSTSNALATASGVSTTRYLTDERQPDPTNTTLALGTTRAIEAEAVVVPVTQPGRHRVSLSYGTNHDDGACSFRDRVLWLGVLR